MTSLENCPDIENPQVDLRRLEFHEVEDRDGKSVHQALVDDSDAPGGPVYALTVTTASPGDDEKAKAELDAFLDEMRAGFVLTAPNPDEPPCDDQEPDPFDIGTQTQIEPGLVQLRTLKGTFGVTVVVQTAADGDHSTNAEEAAAEPAPGQPIRARVTVQPGKEHTYTAVGGLKTATVTARQGSGTIRKPQKGITAGGGPRSLTASRVIVHGNTLMVYDFVGRFNQTA
jgi:hypothetical protein